MGSPYLRGNIWWIRYCVDGEKFCESSKSAKKTDAKELLALREGQKVEGRLPGRRTRRITLKELADDYLADQRVNKRKACDHAERYARNLVAYFGEHSKAASVTTEKVNVYIQRRIEDGLENSSINRELSALKRMFSLGMRATPPKVHQRPHIPKLKESNVRRGFYEHNEYRRLMTVLPEYLRLPFSIGYHSGMRKEEILSIEIDKQLNLIEGKIVLDPGTTKNDEPRVFFLSGELYEMVHEQVELTKRLYPDCPYLCHYKGHKINDFREAWATACKNTGLEGRLFHDLRRTGVRNLIRAGNTQKEAKLISGHKTDSVFERYNIIDERDLKNASIRLQAYLDEQDKKLKDRS